MLFHRIFKRMKDYAAQPATTDDVVNATVFVVIVFLLAMNAGCAAFLVYD